MDEGRRDKRRPFLSHLLDYGLYLWHHRWQDIRCLTDREDPRVIGTTLHNRYRIDAELGQGGMGRRAGDVEQAIAYALEQSDA